MEVAGLGLGAIQMPSAQGGKDSSTSNKLKGFNQLLLATLGNSNSLSKVMDSRLQGNVSPSEGTELLAFLKTNNLQQVAGGNELLQQLLNNPETDLMQMVKDFLGISDQKWSEILAGFGGDAKEKVGDDRDVMEAILAGFTGMTGNQFMPSLNQNAQLFLKAAKLYDLLATAKDPSDQQQPLTNLMAAVTDKLVNISQLSQKEIRQQYLDQTFAKTASEVNEASENRADRGTSVKLVEWSGSHAGMQLWTKPEQIAMMADPARKQITSNDLQQQFQAILAKSQFSKTGGLQKLLIKLNPEHLGSLRIELTQRDQTLVAKILTSTNLAKEALESHLNGLKHAFAAQNIQVDRIEIGQQASQPDRFLKDNQQNGQNMPEQRRQDQQQTEKEDEPIEGFILSLDEALLNTEA